jgi:hypothetical protein
MVMGEIVPHPNADVGAASEVPSLMDAIRPQWQAKGLIERVRRLLPVDPSSACQRLFNAAVADLRDKVKIAGIDIAKEAAASFKLPLVDRTDDIDNYSTAKILDLAFHMGLLSRPEWRRMLRVYDIRRDLEHEDSEYEAGIEDCIYIFKTCIEAVLSKDPVSLIKASEVRQIIEAAGPAVAGDDLIEDFEHAPDPRQLAILRMLVGVALSEKEPDLVRQNGYVVLRTLGAVARDGVRVQLAKDIQDDLGRRPLTELEVRVASTAGILPYLRKTQRVGFFKSYYEQMRQVGYQWRSNASHGALIRPLSEFGGIAAIPDDVRKNIVRWLALCYIGEPGGYGDYGRGRRVFYSNSGVPIVKELFVANRDSVRPILDELTNDGDVKRACANKDVGRRYQDLLDLVTD